jgi:hypothetical protein
MKASVIVNFWYLKLSKRLVEVVDMGSKCISYCPLGAASQKQYLNVLASLAYMFGVCWDYIAKCLASKGHYGTECIPNHGWFPFHVDVFDWQIVFSRVLHLSPFIN